MLHDDHTAHSDPHLAHHFDTPTQQFESGRLGMWLFLATEILLFGGLFCAYAVYRANHPEIFLYAHRYLDTKLGATNTAILIFSSFTMAWAVRCAQLGKRRGLLVLLSLTLICAFGFLCVKGIEYEHKWKHGLLWGEKFDPGINPSQASHGVSPTGTGTGHAAALATPARAAHESKQGSTAELIGDKAASLVAAAGKKRPSNVHIFFGIYFLMTGLHAVHVIVGMGVIAWILSRAIRGDFTDGYFTPVDLAGLYWHLVDLIWIYLFPLLYLIH